MPSLWHKCGVGFRLTLGIDEAGRGPVLGPMVVAAVLLDTHAARALSRAGLQDSKNYGPPALARPARREMAARIRRRARFVGVRVIDVAIIDQRVALGELNVLEREAARALIAESPTAHRMVADGRAVFGPLSLTHPTLEAKDRGEQCHAAVAAASIIAKDRRDALFSCIAARYRPLFGELGGGGYGNAATRRFLCAYVARFGRLPPEARRSWPHPYLAEILGRDHTVDPFFDMDATDRPGQRALFA